MDQSIEDECESRNRIIQSIMLALMTMSIRCLTSRFWKNETKEYVRTAPAVTANVIERITSKKLKLVNVRISQADPVIAENKKPNAMIPNMIATTLFSQFDFTTSFTVAAQIILINCNFAILHSVAISVLFSDTR